MRQNRISHVSGIQAFCKANYVYLAIPKNGLCTHTEFFERKGWRPRNIMELGSVCGTQLIYISHIRKPINRYIKGIVQSFKNSDTIDGFIEKMEKDPTYLRHILTSTNDDHTSSIWSMFPPQISPYQVNWIPMDHPKWSSNFLTNQLFRELNLPYKIEDEDITHISDEYPKKVQQYITKKMLEKDRDGNIILQHGYGAFFSSLLSEDQNIYDYVMAQYKVREPFYEDIFLEEFPEISPYQPHWYTTEEEEEKIKELEVKMKDDRDDRPDVLKFL
jgi:hypothetical protein